MYFGCSMGETSSKDLLPARLSGRQLAGRGRRRTWTEPAGSWLVVVLVALLLAACGSETNGAGTSPAERRPAADISESSLPEATESPTVVLPTATPTVVTPPAPLAARVNGQYIFLDDYEKLVAHHEQALVEKGLDPTSDQGQVRLAQIRQEVLESMIDHVLIEQGGAALGVSVSGKDVAVQIEADIAAGGGETAFKEWLETAGQTLEEYEQMTREALLAQRVLEGIGADVPAVAEQVHARLIILDSEEEARRVLVKLQEGASFEELVQELSVDVRMRDKDGDLGWFPRGWIAPELESVAFGLQAGEVSEVIRLGDRYYILQTLERDESRALSPDAYLELQLAAFQQWLVQQREAADIERFVDE